jgi:small subunit ribosomal protein S6
MNNKKGHYYFLGIQANQLIVDELERKAKFSESIIRYSLVKVKQIDKDVSPILQEEMNDTDNTVDVTAKKN